MRSAEQSGVGADGFSVGKGQNSAQRPEGKNTHSGSIFGKVSPVTRTVALTAVLAATLFIIYDVARTLDEARRDLTAIGALMASEIAVAPEPLPRLQQAVRLSGGVVHARLHDDTAVAPRTTLVSEQFPLGQHGILLLEANEELIWPGLIARAMAALALAALFTGLSWRRSQLSEMPDRMQRFVYQTLASAVPMGMACWTKSGQLVVCNQQYRERLDLNGTSVTYPQMVKRLIAGGYMKLVNDADNTRLMELHREDGSCMLIEERPLGDGSFITLVTDVTERKKADSLLNSIREEQRLLARRYHEEKLKAEAASRSKTNFLAHLSHDVRTPLNHIIGFAELMRHEAYGPLGDRRYKDYVQSIKSSGEHLLDSFATILDLAELEGGQKMLRTDPLNVDELLDEVGQRFRGQTARAGLTFVRGEECGAIVHGDRLGLLRMIGNIVENAIRFTPTGGRVTLAAFAAHDGVVIEITDTGLGMSEERLASIAQPFALGDATFTREGVGHGLGISISRAIAELSGGHMAIDSSPSLGTTVAISLPLRSQEGIQAAE